MTKRGIEKMTTTLLINESPLQLQPSIAKKLGINEAIVLQQFNYWISKSDNIKEGYRWTYNTYEEWNLQFPFFSLSTLIRTIKRLEKKGILITDNFNHRRSDATKWYRIDYDKLNEIMGNTSNGSGIFEEKSKSQTQTHQPDHSNCTKGSSQAEQSVTYRLPETTTKDLNNSSSTDEPSSYTKDFETIWEQYPKKSGKRMAFKAYVTWRKEDQSHDNAYLMRRLAMYQKDLEINYWKQPMGGAAWFSGRFNDHFQTEFKTSKLNQRRAVIQRETLPDWAVEQPENKNKKQASDPKVLEQIQAGLAYLRSRKVSLA